MASYLVGPAKPNSDVDEKKVVGPVSLQGLHLLSGIQFPQAKKETVSGPLSYVHVLLPSIFP